MFRAPIVILMTMSILRPSINLGYTYGAPRDRDISRARCLVPMLCLRLCIADCVQCLLIFSLSPYVTNNNSSLFLLCGRLILNKTIILCSTCNTKLKRLHSMTSISCNKTKLFVWQSHALRRRSLVLAFELACSPLHYVIHHLLPQSLGKQYKKWSLHCL